MPGRLVLPDNRIDHKMASPVIYLAGPVDDAPEWQFSAARLLLSDSNITVACPRKKNLPEDLKKYLVEPRSDNFVSTNAWVDYYMDQAQNEGAILFWLPNATSHSLTNPYAFRTMFHLGQVLPRFVYDKSSNGDEHPINFCIGIEEGFPYGVKETPYYKFIKDVVDRENRNREIFTTLEDLCNASKKLAKAA